MQTSHMDVPNWVNWVVVVGGAALSWIQPIAGLVAITWGGLQIWAFVRNKKWKQ